MGTVEKNSDLVIVFVVPLDGQLPDVCYSWWVLASLKIIGRIHWIDKAKLRAFILACQDEETGGFADRPGDMVSLYATARRTNRILIYRPLKSHRLLDLFFGFYLSTAKFLAKQARNVSVSEM